MSAHVNSSIIDEYFNDGSRPNDKSSSIKKQSIIK